MQTLNTLLSRIELNPNTKPRYSIIWLHGLGADGNDFAPIVPELNLPSELAVRFVFPNAPQMPVTINNGYIMPAWYDITSMDINQRIDKKGMAASVSALEKLIAEEEKLGIPTENILLAGFSQGAVIALATGLTFPKPLAGIMALSGYLPYTEAELSEINSSKQTLPIFIAHGTQDTVVPYQVGLAANDLLSRAGFKTEWHSYPMAHGVCGPEIHDIATWIKKIFR